MMSNPVAQNWAGHSAKQLEIGKGMHSLPYKHGHYGQIMRSETALSMFKVIEINNNYT